MTLGKNLSKLRRERGLTQEELSARLHVSAQAVSRWETEQTTPDLSTLTQLADELNVSLDALCGHAAKSPTPYEAWYQSDEYYWGTKPSSLCMLLLRLMPPGEKPIRVLDIGCGEGRDAVFLARCGYQVTAFDLAPSGIEKLNQLARRANVQVESFCADVNHFRLAQTYDVLFSSGVLHYIRPENRAAVMENWQSHTAPGGMNLFNVFVEKPFIAPPPEQEESHPWKSGELFRYYADWRFEHMEEKIFDCHSSGVPHQHAMDVMACTRG